MSLFSWMRYIPFSVSDATKTAGSFKDAIANPSETSGNLVKNIVRVQPFIIQRIIAIGLLIGAMLLGADIGIEYQKSQAPQPPISSIAPPNPLPVIPKAENPEEIPNRVNLETEDPKDNPSVDPPPNFTEPVARTAERQIEQRVLKERPRTFNKSGVIKGRSRQRGPEIYKGPFSLSSSGPGGY